MYFLSQLAGWEEFYNYEEFAWLASVFKWLYPTLYAIMAVAGAAGAIYAIVLGINLARAEDQSKRDEAKKRLITVLIAVAVVILLIVFFNELLPIIIKAIVGDPAENPIKPEGTGAILLSLLK